MIGALDRRLPIAAALLVAVGVVLGAVSDHPAPRPPVTRGGYRVLEADFHAHTRFADGFLSPFDLVIQADRKGLDVLAVTDHNILFPALLSRAFSRFVGGPTILVGEEITARRYHLHGVGLTERVDASAPMAEVLAAIHRQGGVAIVAHPTRRFWPAFEPFVGPGSGERFDATEVMHPIAFGSVLDAGRPKEAPAPEVGAGAGRGWRWEDVRDFYDKTRASGHAITAIASSDYHFGSVLGVCRTLLFSRSASEEDALDALRAGRTVVTDLQGRMYGDPAMIALLKAEPYALRPVDYQYRGAGLLDRIGRALGWLGLLGLVLFGRRSR
jgi:hypothetical protein